MDELTRWLRRTLDALEVTAAEPEKLGMLRERELGVRVEHDRDGPYVPAQSVEE
jgi:hypothetical protein